MKIISRKPTFEGRTEEPKGHIFECSDAKQADSYTNTIKDIAQYVVLSIRTEEIFAI